METEKSSKMPTIYGKLRKSLFELIFWLIPGYPICYFLLYHQILVTKYSRYEIPIFKIVPKQNEPSKQKYLPES